MRQVDFEHGSVGRNMLQSAVPMLVAQLFALLYNIVDRIFLGRIPGEGTMALAGVGLCFPLVILTIGFANLFGTGGAPLFSIALGAKDRESAKHIQTTAFLLLSGAALIITAVGLLFSRPFLLLFGASEATLPYALPYLRIYLLGTFFSMAVTGMNPFINAQGYTGFGMLTVSIGALLNVALDPVFIFALHLGTSGAAIATVISQFISAVLVLWYLRRRCELRLTVHRPRDFATVARNITSLGTAGFIMAVTNALVTLSCNSVLSRFGGDLYVSIMTILASVRQFVDVPALAVSEGTSPVMSYNFGAERPGNVRKAIRLMTIANLTYTLAIWLFILWKPQWFIGIFTNDKTILADAIPALHLYFFAFIGQGLQYCGQTTFKALNKKRQAIFFSLFRKAIIVIPLTYLLPHLFGLGTDGVFMAEPVSNVVGGTACFVTMMLTVWRELGRAMKESDTEQHA